MKALVVLVRGLQLGTVGCYGNQWIDTPALDGLAARGVVFDGHFADRADAAGARRAWRTGCYHLPGPARQAGPTGSADLLDALREKEIHTCLIVDDSRPPTIDFTAGWNEVERIAVGDDTSALEAMLEAAQGALERLSRRDNWLLWIELAALLPPWNVPDEFREPYFREEEIEEDEEETEESDPLTPLSEIPAGPIDPEDDHLYLSVQTSYAAAVTYLDAGIGQLLDALDSDDVFVLLTTDLGQSLGEHGTIDPLGGSLHDEVVHLPLLVRLPGGTEAGRRIAALTQAVDLAPTLADWFQASLPQAHGSSLLPLAKGEIESIRPCAFIGRPVGEAAEYCLRTPEWALFLPQQRLYVKPDDRWEVNDVVQHHPELVERLEQTLRDFLNSLALPTK